MTSDPPVRARLATLTVAGASLVLGLGITLWPGDPTGTSDPLDIAMAQIGHHRYRVDLRDEVVGSYDTETVRDGDRLIFTSALRTRLPGAGAVAVEKRMEFATRPPYALIRAVQERREGESVVRVEIRSLGDAYEANVLRGDDRERHVLHWSYQLADHLGVERWLRSSPEQRADTHRSRQLDFDRLHPIATEWQLLETTPDGDTLVARTAAGGDAVLFLDRDLVPRATSLAGVFTVTRLPADTPAPAPGPVTHSRIAVVRLSEALRDPAELTHVRLALNSAAAVALRDTLPVTREPGGWHVDLIQRPPAVASVTDMRSATGATVDLPSDHPRIARLAHRAIAGTTSPDTRIERLTWFVHQWLHYRSDGSTAGLFDALDRRAGDCIEFADLLTSLARAVGMPARTVIGLAYAEEDGPGFYLHAWTEIAAGGEWHAVDATFGRVDLGPTHIRFPDSDSGYLRAYAAIPEMRFEVVATEYAARESDR